MEESSCRTVECNPCLNSHLRDTNHIFHLSDHPTLPQVLTENSPVGLTAIAYTEKQVFVDH